MEAINDSLDEEVDETHYHDAMIQKIFNAIEENGLTPTDRYQIIEENETREFEKKFKKEGLKEGLEAGHLKEKQSIAKNLLTANIAIEVIMQTTGLTYSEIKKLILAKE